MTALRGANDALAFLLELAALAALVTWGFAVGPNLLLRIVLGVGAPATHALIGALGRVVGLVECPVGFAAVLPIPRGLFSYNLWDILIRAPPLLLTDH